MNDIDIANYYRAILTMTLSGSILALVLFALRPLIKNRLSKTFQYYLWLIVLAQLLIPFSPDLPITKPISVDSSGSSQMEETAYQNQYPQYARETYTVRDMVDRYVFSNERTVDPVPAPLPSTDSDADAIKNIPNTLPFHVIGLMMILWPLGAIFVLAFNLLSYFTLIKSIKKTLVLTEINTASFGSRIPVYRGAHVTTPMLIGVYKAKIILPDREYEAAQLADILRHEVMHRHRHDLLIKWLVTFAVSIHWFNPVVYFVRKEMNRACELSCDEAIIKNLNGEEKQAYGNTLISAVAETRSPFVTISTTMCDDKNRLKERLRAIMDYKKSTKLAMILSIALMFTLTASAFAMNASSVLHPDSFRIKLDGIHVSDLPTWEIHTHMVNLTGATGGMISFDVAQDTAFHLTGDFEWDYANTLVVLASHDTKYAAEPFTAYQMKFERDSSEVSLTRLGRQPSLPPSARIESLGHLLDALKYLPAETLKDAVSETPASYSLHISNERPQDNLPVIYYDRYGVKDMGMFGMQDGFILCLDLTPSYSSETGGHIGQSADTIHLCYTAPSHSLDDLEYAAAFHMAISFQRLSEKTAYIADIDASPFHVFLLRDNGDYWTMAVKRNVTGWNVAGAVRVEDTFDDALRLVGWMSYKDETDAVTAVATQCPYPAKAAYIEMGQGDERQRKYLTIDELADHMVIFTWNDLLSWDELDAIACSEDGTVLYRLGYIIENNTIYPDELRWIPEK